MQREAGKNGGGIPLLNPLHNKGSQSSLHSHTKSNAYQNEMATHKVETDGVDINDTSMTDIH